MSIVQEIERIKNNIARAYDACASKGATMPDVLNSENLVACIYSIVKVSSNNATDEQINAILNTMTIESDGDGLKLNIPDSVDIDFTINENGELLVSENYDNIEFSINENELEVAY